LAPLRALMGEQLVLGAKRVRSTLSLLSKPVRLVHELLVARTLLV
jgi:hypothetical protein